MTNLKDLYKQLGYSPQAGYLSRVCRQHSLGRRVSGIELTKQEVAKLKKIVEDRKR